MGSKEIIKETKKRFGIKKKKIFSFSEKPKTISDKMFGVSSK